MAEQTETQSIPESSQASQVTAAEPLPELKTPHHKRNLFRALGLSFVAIDLAILPITYYFALKYGTDLSLQTGRQLNSLDKACLNLANLTSLCNPHGDIWHDIFHAFRISILTAFLVKMVTSKYACWMDKMGNGEASVRLRIRRDRTDKFRWNFYTLTSSSSSSSLKSNL